MPAVLVTTRRGLTIQVHMYWIGLGLSAAYCRRSFPDFSSSASKASFVPLAMTEFGQQQDPGIRDKDRSSQLSSKCFM